jgi:hypothetical protein
MTFSIKPFNIMAFIIKPFNIITFSIKPFNIITFSIKSFNTMVLSIKAYSIKAFSIMALSIKTFSITNTLSSNDLHYAECCNAKCRILLIVMDGINMLSVIKLNDVMQNVAMMSVMAS